MPQLRPWLAEVVESVHVRALAEAVRASSGGLGAIDRRIVAEGSRGSSTSLVAAGLAKALGRTVLLVVAHLDEADDALDDLELLSGGGGGGGGGGEGEAPALSVERFGALEVLPGESAVNLELLAERLGTVQRLAAGDMPDVLIAPIQALMQPVPEPDALSAFTLGVERGQRLEPAALLDWLDRAGYTRQDAVEQPGDFATRGGIIDVYPPAGSALDTEGRPLPGAGVAIRVDFFGDEVDDLHRIDLDTMGSAGPLRSAQLVGASAERIQAEERTTSLLRLLPGDAVPVLHEVLELSEQARGYYERLADPRGIIPPNELFKRLTARPHVEANQYSPRNMAADEAVIELPLAPLPSFDTDAKSAVRELGDLAADPSNRVIVLCRRTGERDRLRELLAEEAPEQADRVELEVAGLHRGFVWQSSPPGPGEGASPGGSTSPAALPPRTPPGGRGTAHGDCQHALVLLPHHELFHRYDRPAARRRIRQVSTAGIGGTAASGGGGDAFLDLDVGDHVVHVEHGIARFTGLKTMRRQRGGEQISEEYLTLEFAGKAVLHVPATQIDLIQKYVGGFGGKRPPLSQLGGKRWQRQKDETRESVKDLAAELLRVQAARATIPGVQYPGDTTWQKEFEAEFPYDETDDQVAAIAAMKRDMTEPRPMDRLVCGDVGFGKTEVAIRGAFKAVEYGKQVAVLVPTTVLAEQHERTFRGRFADYPFRVESVSRFKTAGEAKGVLSDLAHGKVDVIIGTHRLLSEDVKFADLGLVIIDEEQRFGVEHKNKLLRFRLTADVLTLTATPIPRTLHMSMMGLRDISSLSTAPVDRRAVVTEVTQYKKNRVKNAIIRELNRDGQVFFVHNRVHNIRSVADDLRQLVPEARIVIGHGQMPPRELEAVMLKFVRGEADILVSTTIIESGIDIPTANTMFINRADHFGLAELHQLRGRVGRYKHRAYCYLLLPEDRAVSEVAAKRLQAIENFSMLGAGFKIAMRDLELRGAGNLLGAEQSGHIAAVGYEMYCLLLEQETKKLKNEPVIEPSRTHLELPIKASLPKRWIGSVKYRMDAYRRLSRATTLKRLDAVTESLTGAYGDPPPPAQALLELTEVRVAASTLGVDTLKLDGPDLVFTCRSPRKLSDAITDAPGRVTVLDDKTVYWRPPPRYTEPESLLPVLRKLLVRPTREAETASPEDPVGSAV